MSDIRWHRIEEIFHQAVALSPEVRSAFLDDACQADAPLRSQVEVLLAHEKEEGQTFAGRPEGQAAGPAPQSLRAGDRLGPYEITGFIGAGSMGEVYRAHDPRLRRNIAVKVLPTELSQDPTRRQRFEREAHAVAALNHPNILAIHDVGEDCGRCFIVTELLDGEPLCEVRPDIEKVLDIGVQIASGLEAAHEAGIVHRDLKPGNILLDRKGHVKILDFGLAKLVKEAGDHARHCEKSAPPETHSGIMGTLGYMSPEQARGDPVDQRSDIYSFGWILYELLADNRAVRGSIAEVLSGVLQKEPPDLPARVPPALRRFVDKCLEEDRAKRFQSASELLRAIRRLSKSNPWSPVVWIGLIAAMFMAALWAGSRQWRVSTTLIRPTVLTSFIGLQADPSLSPDGKQFAFAWNGDVPRGKPHIYISPAERVAPRRLTPEDEAGNYPSWSPDGESVAFFRILPSAHQSELSVMSSRGGPIRSLASGLATSNFFPSTPAWSPDGKWLIWRKWDDLTRSSSINVTPAAGGETRTLIDDSKRVILNNPAVSPNGRQLVWCRCVTSYDCELFVADFNDGRLTSSHRQISHDHRLKYDPLWANGGKELIYIAGDHEIDLGIYRVQATGGTPRRIEGTIGAPRRLTLSAKGDRLVYSTRSINYDIHRINLSSTEPKAETFLSSTRYESHPAWSPDGKRITFCSARGGERQIWVADADGANVSALTSFPEGMAEAPSWSPDAKSIAFLAHAEGNGDVFTVSATGGPAKRLTSGPAEHQAPTWSPDGKWIYFGSTDTGQREIFRMRPDGSEARQMTHGGGFYGVSSPDGKWLFYSIPTKGLWKMPSEGGDPVQILERSALVDHFGFAVTPEGIYAMEPRQTAGWPVVLYPFSGGKPRTVAILNHAPNYTPTVSPDGRWFLYSAADDPVAYGMMLVKDFR